MVPKIDWMQRHPKTADFMKNHYSPQDLNSQEGRNFALHLYASQAPLEVIEELLENQADPNARFFGQTALHLICQCENSERQKDLIQVVKVLLAKGADLHAVTEDSTVGGGYPGKNALWFAVRNNTMPIVEVLLNAGAKDDCGALLHAVQRKAIDFMRCVLPVATEKCKNLAFKWAAENNNVTFIHHFLNHGVDINGKDDKGNTTLHRVVQLNYTKVVEFLLEHDADIDSKNLQGETPLYACATSYISSDEMMMLLLNKGAQPELSNQSGIAALLEAARRTQKNIQLLQEACANKGAQDTESSVSLQHVPTVQFSNPNPQEQALQVNTQVSSLAMLPWFDG